MGFGSSRRRQASWTGSYKRRWAALKRSFSSLVACGSSPRTLNEMEDNSDALPRNSARRSRSKKFDFLGKDAVLSPVRGSTYLKLKAEPGNSIRRSKSFANPGPGSSQSKSDRGKGLSRAREVDSVRYQEVGSTSNIDQSSSAASISRTPCLDGEDRVDVNTKFGSPCLCADPTNYISPPSHSQEGSSLDAVSVENNAAGLISFYSPQFASASDSPADNHPVRDGQSTSDELTPEFVVRQNRRDMSVLHVDLLSISSSNGLSTSPADTSSTEARRTSRTIFWDAFSRHNSRSRTDTSSLVPSSSEESDNSRSVDRWNLDLAGDFFNDGVGGDLRSYRTRGLSSRSSEIEERLRHGLDVSDPSNSLCPRGIHPDGMCSCDPSLTAQEPRGGISRIVMLAEALFEVLDEIHRQPVALSLTMVSLPAPERIVNSLPVKTHETLQIGNEVSQCYICLADYEEGEKIRILPCHHEYHMACVDRWLKEIHGVCPLCRADVREGFLEASDCN